MATVLHPVGRDAVEIHRLETGNQCCTCGVVSQTPCPSVQRSIPARLRADDVRQDRDAIHLCRRWRPLGWTVGEGYRRPQSKLSVLTGTAAADEDRKNSG